MPTITCPHCDQTITYSQKITVSTKKQTPTPLQKETDPAINPHLNWWLAKGFMNDPALLISAPYLLSELSRGFEMQFELPTGIVKQNMRRWLASVGQTDVTQSRWGKIIDLDWQAVMPEGGLVVAPTDESTSIKDFAWYPTLYPYPMWSRGVRRYQGTPATQAEPPIISAISIPYNSLGDF